MKPPSSSTDTNTNSSPGTLLALLAFTLVLGLMLGMAELVIRLASKVNPDTGVPHIGSAAWLPYVPGEAEAKRSWAIAGESTYIVRDAELGWTIRPNGKAAAYTATAQGFRGPAGWAAAIEVPPGVQRVAVYGDSFTHGDQVALEETWADRLQHMGPNREVLNFGVSAYGSDQALLRFRRDGRRFSAQTQVLGIWPEDIMRNVSVIRFYLIPNGNIGNSKPRFVVTPGGLEIVNSPTMSEQAFMDTLLGRAADPAMKHDHWYREREIEASPAYLLHSVRATLGVYNAYLRREERSRMYFDREGEALTITAAIAEQFVREARAHGSRAFVSIIPMRDLLEQHADGSFPLPGMLRQRGVPVLDLAAPFALRARDTREELFLPDGHLTPAGNRLFAELLDRELFPPAADTRP